MDKKVEAVILRYLANEKKRKILICTIPKIISKDKTDGAQLNFNSFV